ncbi:MAG TPA: helix-turn-helix domain-containing protein [Geothrix sp.]|nr:helix-turn-helix domain-containing protein [Geothrix sp.]
MLVEPARAAMLARLLDGRAWTATELSAAASIRPSTGSAHLSKLLALGWVEVLPQGRHRYYRLAGQEVAAFLESFARLAPDPEVRTPGERRASEALRHCRLCYDHLAGRVGVVWTEGLLAQGWLEASAAGYTATPTGRRGLVALGLAGFDETSEPMAGRTCMDWSERRLHIAGPLGRNLAEGLLALGWFQRDPRSRALWVTPLGREGYRRVFGRPLPEQPGSDLRG